MFVYSNRQSSSGIQSPLKYQTRCVATFPSKEGFLVSQLALTEKLTYTFFRFPADRRCDIARYTCVFVIDDVDVYVAGWFN